MRSASFGQLTIRPITSIGAFPLASPIPVGTSPSIYNSPSVGTLLNILGGESLADEICETDEYGNMTYSNLSGTPKASAETCTSAPDRTPPDADYFFG